MNKRQSVDLDYLGKALRLTQDEALDLVREQAAVAGADHGAPTRPLDAAALARLERFADRLVRESGLPTLQ